MNPDTLFGQRGFTGTAPADLLSVRGATGPVVGHWVKEVPGLDPPFVE
jgi:hypothetical protein